jgi:hypothetical protein
MVEKLRLGRRLAVGAAVIFGVLFAVVGQGAHRAAAIGLDASVVSISGSPEVPEGSTAQFTATISPAAAGDFDVDYTASAGGVSGSFHVTAGDTSELVNVGTTDNGFPDASPRSFTVTLTDTNDTANGSTVDPTPVTGLLDNIDPPSSVVSIGNANAAVIEGSPATFPVSISPAAGVAFNVNYTASAGGVSGSFHVSQGATSMQVPVATVDNGTPEDDKTFTVTLTGTNATNGSTVDGTPASGTIIDNDWTITLSPINPAAVSEQGGSIQFAATLNAAAPQKHAISVHYAVADGSAVLGTNYTVSQAASGTLTFSPGNTAKTVTVTGKDDGVYLAGAGKTFTMTLSSPSGATIAGSASSTGTINDADTAPQMGISSCSGGKVAGGSPAIFPVRVQASTVPATVTYTTSGVNTLPGDFDGGTGTITIPPGGAVREFDLTIPTHAIAPAGSRIFDVQLSSPQGARFGTSLAPCTIVSSGSAASTVPTLQITNPVPVVEPASGSTSVPVTVTLNAPAAQTTPTDVHIHWQTADGSATAGADYAAASGDLTWPAGVYNSQTFSVQVSSNLARTAQGTFTIAFSSPDSSAGFLGAPTATVTVLPVGSTASLLSIADASAPEKQGSIPVVVSLTPAAGQTAVTVDYATADGSGSKGAFAGTDYTAKSGTLTFTQGQSTQTISIPITPYSGVQPNKSFQVVLSNPVGATLANSTATLTILNDNVKTVLPPINNGGTGPQKKPVQVPTKRTDTAHPVSVQLLTGESRANAKGQATYRISCPDVVIQLCAGTVVFDVRVQAKPKKGSKKKPALTNVRVGSGTFSVHTGKTGTVVIKLTKPGMALLKSVKRLKVKATINAKDGAGVKGVTAWFVSVDAPAPIVKKPTTKKPTTKKK